MRSGSVRTTVAFVCLLCLSTPTVAQTGGHVWPGERYGTAVVAAVVAVFLLQSALIVALLLERRVRRRAQAALIESEARAEIAGVSLGVGFWSWDPDRDGVWISEQCARLLGFERRAYPPLASFLGRGSAAHRRVARRCVRAGDAGRRTVRRRVGGRDAYASTRWIAGAIRTSADGHGKRRVTGRSST
jgi:PAS domain-containing protein